MFYVWSFRGLGGIVSSGLGGGSLIYANVLLRKDRSSFVQEDLAHGGFEYWPVDATTTWSRTTTRREQMLAATPYPFDRRPTTDAARRGPCRRRRAARARVAAAAARGHLRRARRRRRASPCATTTPNLHGRTRPTCRLCGECDIGCNYGSKNTLDYNYLSLASMRHGAPIRTRSEVKSFAPRPAAATRSTTSITPRPSRGRSARGSCPRHRITADRLVLSAGTFGTTYLLLKNRAAFPALSDRLGTHFCGNGDLLMLALESKEDDGRPRIVDPGYGAVITSTVRVKDAAEGGPGRAYYIQDGGHPQIVNWIVETSYQLGVVKRLVHFALGLVRLWLRLVRRSEIGREVAAAFGPAKLSSTSFPLFSMGRDIPDGKMTLTSDGYLDADWKTRRSNELFENVRKTGKQMSHVLHAEFKDNLPWYVGRSATVHPLGGCPMGRDEREGVVDSYGRVFGYPGLYIADGSVLPGPVGPNPSNTIAALAHRFAEQLIADAR